MIDVPTLIIFSAVFGGSILSVVAGGGVGIIMLIVFSFFLDIRTTIVTMALLGFLIQLTKMSYFFKSIAWNDAKLFMLSSLPTAYAGGYFLYVISPDITQKCLGVFCLLFVATRLFQFAPTVQATNGRLLLFGGINGILSGSIGSAALIRNPILLSLGHKKEAFMGTSAVIAIVTNFGRIPAYMQNFQWNEQVMHTLIVCAVAISLGMYTGKRLLQFVSTTLFEKLLLCIIAVGAIRLLLF